MAGGKRLPIVLYQYEGDKIPSFTFPHLREKKSDTSKELIGVLHTFTYAGFVEAFRDGDPWALEASQDLIDEFKEKFKLNQSIANTLKDPNQTNSKELSSLRVSIKNTWISLREKFSSN